MGTYFHSEPTWSLPRRVREPQITSPYTGKLRRQLIAWMFSVPFCRSVRTVVRPDSPVRLASMPAGAFQTPLDASVAAYSPATKPQGGKARARPCCNGSGAVTHGK